MSLDPKTLKELSELLERATPGPWKTLYVARRTAWVVPASVPEDFQDEPIATLYKAEAGARDAALIVAAVNALPSLLAVAEEAERYRAALNVIAVWTDTPTIDEEGAQGFSHFDEPGSAELARAALAIAPDCSECGQPMLPPGEKKRSNEYDHASGCPRAPARRRKGAKK